MTTPPVRRPAAAGLLLVSLLAACDSQTPPTQPAPPSPVPAPATPPQVVGLQVTGPGQVAPGEGAGYLATARFADGSTRDVTAEALWRSSDEAVLTITSAGAMVTRAMGEAEVRATFGPMSHARAVLVLPEGRFVMHVMATEDQVTAGLLGARVEVIDGPAAGLAATTGWDGSATLLGVPMEVRLRLTKDGYEPVVREVRLDRQRMVVHVQMLPSRGRIDPIGAFQLTIAAGTCDEGNTLPEALRTRTFDARIWNGGLTLTVLLSGPALAVQDCPLCGGARGNTFKGQVQALDARFTLRGYVEPWDWNDGVYPDVVEHIPGEGYLAISGQAVVTPTISGLSGLLDGAFAIYDHLGTNVARGTVLKSCRARDHRFTLTRQ